MSFTITDSADAPRSFSVYLSGFVVSVIDIARSKGLLVLRGVKGC
ncbi:MAG: hypothetical protein AAF383_12895 [Cyanobacteria bacterium P01_A01_bin.83]